MITTTHLANVSVSHGTMVTENLIETFIGFLEVEHPVLGAKMREEYETDHKYRGYREEFLNETLWDVMDELSPEGFYFGAHPGDGSDYGYWEIEDWNEDISMQ